MTNCIFCKILAKDIPCNKVYEDDDVIAFLDIRPISDGHTIVIPKKHIQDLENMSYDELFTLTAATKSIGKAMMNGLEVKGYSIFLDNKSDANQHVPHVHFHVVPRAKGDGLDRWPQQDRYGENEAKVAAERIKAELA